MVDQKEEIMTIKIQLGEIFAILKRIEGDIRRYSQDHDLLIKTVVEVEKQGKDINSWFVKFRVMEERVNVLEQWKGGAMVWLSFIALVASSVIGFVTVKILKW